MVTAVVVAVAVVVVFVVVFVIVVDDDDAFVVVVSSRGSVQLPASPLSSVLFTTAIIIGMLRIATELPILLLRNVMNDDGR